LNENRRDLVDKFDRQVTDRVQVQTMPETECPTIHYTELPADTSSPIAAEWNFYRQEAGRLLAEGHEGRWVLIKAERIIGIWGAHEAAYEAALKN